MSGEEDKLRAGPVVVVEIGQDWLKILYAEPSRAGATVKALHLEPLDASGTCAPARMSELWKQLRLPKDNIVACLPRQAVNVRILDLPSTDPTEIADMIELQAGKHTPHSRDEVIIDYRIVGKGKEGYSQVLLVIAPRSAVRQRYYVLEEAGLSVRRMTVSSEGLLGAFVLAGPQSGTGVVLDVDSGCSDLAVVDGGRLVFTRSLQLGSSHLLGSDAEWRSKFVQEVQRSLEACRAERGDVECGPLWLTGAGAAVDGLPSELKDQLGIPVEVRDSAWGAVKAPASPSLKDAAYRGVSVTALLGIGMGPDRVALNFVPDSVLLRRGLLRRAQLLTAFGVLTMAALLAGSLYLSIGLVLRWDRRNRGRDELESMMPDVRRVTDMQDVVKAIRARRAGGVSVLSMLGDLHGTVPEDLLLENVELDVAASRFSVEGTSGSRQAIRALVQGLEQAPRFREVKEEGATSQDARTGRFRFRITFSPEGPT